MFQFAVIALLVLALYLLNDIRLILLRAFPWRPQ